MRPFTYILLGIATVFVLEAVTLLFSFSAHADIELKSLYVDYKNFAILNDKNRNLLTYPEPAKEGVALGFTSDAFTYGYVDAEVQGTTVEGQYRGVGLEARIGIRLTNGLEVGYYHFSQHVLDRGDDPTGKFPVLDALQLKFFIFRDKHLNREGIF